MDKLIVSAASIDQLVEESRISSRKRAFRLFRSSDKGELPAMMYNAMQLGTYVQPHRHPSDGKEVWIAQRGIIRAILFDERGVVQEWHDVSVGGIAYIEIPPQTFHTAIPLVPDSVICELYLGIYRAETYKQGATWAPSEQADPSVSAEYMGRLLEKTGH